MGYTAIIDYGVGNLKSVSNALAYLGVDSEITGDPCRLELADDPARRRRVPGRGGQAAGERSGADPAASGWE